MSRKIQLLYLQRKGKKIRKAIAETGVFFDEERNLHIGIWKETGTSIAPWKCSVCGTNFCKRWFRCPSCGSVNGIAKWEEV